MWGGRKLKERKTYLCDAVNDVYTYKNTDVRTHQATERGTLIPLNIHVQKARISTDIHMNIFWKNLQSCQEKGSNEYLHLERLQSIS